MIRSEPLAGDRLRALGVSSEVCELLDAIYLMIVEISLRLDAIEADRRRRVAVANFVSDDSMPTGLPN